MNFLVEKSMRTNRHIIIWLAFLAVVLIACNKAFSVKSIILPTDSLAAVLSGTEILHPASVETIVDDTIQLSFAMDYIGGDFKDENLIQPVWETSDKAIVDVDPRGRIFTKAVGNAVVTMSCGGAVGECRVKVRESNSQSEPR